MYKMYKLYILFIILLAVAARRQQERGAVTATSYALPFPASSAPHSHMYTHI